jgi:hypothetical protein
MVVFFYKGKHQKYGVKAATSGKRQRAETKGISQLSLFPAILRGKRLSYSVKCSGLKLQSASMYMAGCLPIDVIMHLLLASMFVCLYNGTVEIIRLWILIRKWSKQRYAFLKR